MMRIIVLWLGVSGLYFLPSPGMASGDVMKGMMRELSESMDRINGGIWRQDFARLALAAEAIAKHPLPPLFKRLELASELGTDAAYFMQSNEEMRDAALALKQAAERQRISQVVSRYQALQQRCVACHTWYRQSVQND